MKSLLLSLILLSTVPGQSEEKFRSQVRRFSPDDFPCCSSRAMEIGQRIINMQKLLKEAEMQPANLHDLFLMVCFEMEYAMKVLELNGTSHQISS